MDKKEKRQYQKEWYEKNREKRLKQNKERYNNNREQIINRQKILRDNRKKEFLDIFKKDRSCELCGYNEHYEILQFHHKDRKQKEFTIGNIKTSDRLSPQKIELVKKEIDKCMVLCPNCHFLLHYKERRRGKKC